MLMVRLISMCYNRLQNITLLHASMVQVNSDKYITGFFLTRIFKNYFRVNKIYCQSIWKLVSGRKINRILTAVNEKNVSYILIVEKKIYICIY